MLTRKEVREDWKRRVNGKFKGKLHAFTQISALPSNITCWTGKVRMEDALIIGRATMDPQHFEHPIYEWDSLITPRRLKALELITVNGYSRMRGERNS